MTKPMSTAAYERATKRSFDTWVSYLDSHGARELDHPDIVPLVVSELARIELTNIYWWAQGITIAYEQEIGRRIPGQRTDGSFASSISKSFPGSMDAAMQAWIALVQDYDSFLELEVVDEPSTSSTQKWRYWRCRLSDDSRVTVTANETSPGKARLAVEHARLASPAAVLDSKAYWKSMLTYL